MSRLAMPTSHDTRALDGHSTSLAIGSIADADALTHRLSTSIQKDDVVMLAQVSALIAHEINNLLTPAAARCDLLRAESDLSGTAATLLDSIQTAVMQASAISKIILKTASGELVGAETRVLPCLCRVIDSLLPMNSRSRVVVENEDSTVCAKIGAVELAHILLNILLNALDATGTKPAAISVRVQADRTSVRSTRNTSAKFVAVTVKDRGCGATRDTLTRCYRTMSWEGGAFVGKNLGTLLCRLLVERAGGEIEVDSAPGDGATVTVFLPQAAS